MPKNSNDKTVAAKPAVAKGRPVNPNLRDHLLDHAIEVLLESGLSGFSMNRVARSAKASKETLYRHFGDRAGLLHASIERVSHILEELLGSGLEDSATTEQRLYRIGMNYLTVAYDPHAVALQRVAYGDGEADLGPLFVRKITNRVVDFVAKEFKALERPNPELDAELFLGAVQGKLYNRVLFGAPPADLDAAIQIQVDGAVKLFRSYLSD